MPLLKTIAGTNNRKKTQPTTNTIADSSSSDSSIGKTRFGVVGGNVPKKGSLLVPIVVESSTKLKSSIDYLAWFRSFRTKFPHLTFLEKIKSTKVGRWRYVFLNRDNGVKVVLEKQDCLNMIDSAVKGVNSQIVTKHRTEQKQENKAHMFVCETEYKEPKIDEKFLKPLTKEELREWKRLDAEIKSDASMLRNLSKNIVSRRERRRAKYISFVRQAYLSHRRELRYYFEA